MLIKKPSILLATYGSLQNFSTNFTGSSTSLKRKRESTRRRTSCQQQCKSYATISGDDAQHHEHHDHPQYSWPKPPQGQPHPTPYQIFQMTDSATYTKARFYELVKVYHPDKNASPDDRISRAVKMERYRMIVAAHNILSDPTKRSAYDRFGAGWNGKAEVGGRETWYQASPYHKPGPFSHSWTHPNDPIWQNATWEDWERWYARKARENGTNADGVRQPNRSGLYLQNSYFLLLVMVLALMGSTANYNRAQGTGQYFVEQRDVIHDRAAKELRRVKREASDSGNRLDRIEWFVRNREATLGLAGSDSETLREEKADRLLPDREVCRSEEIAEKD